PKILDRLSEIARDLFVDSSGSRRPLSFRPPVVYQRGNRRTALGPRLHLFRGAGRDERETDHERLAHGPPAGADARRAPVAVLGARRASESGGLPGRGRAAVAIGADRCSARRSAPALAGGGPGPRRGLPAALPLAGGRLLAGVGDGADRGGPPPACGGGTDAR